MNDQLRRYYQKTRLSYTTGSFPYSPSLIPVSPSSWDELSWLTHMAFSLAACLGACGRGRKKERPKKRDPPYAAAQQCSRNDRACVRRRQSIWAEGVGSSEHHLHHG